MAKEDQEKQSAWGGVSGSRMAWGEWREQDGWGVPKRERMYRKGCRPGVSRLVEGFLDVFDLWQSVPCWTPASKFEGPVVEKKQRPLYGPGLFPEFRL